MPEPTVAELLTELKNAVIQSRQESTPRIQNVKMRTFSGTDGESLSQWLLDFNDYCKCMAYDDAMKLRIIPVYLSGRAKQVYQNSTDNERSSFDNIKNKAGVTLLSRHGH